MFYYARIFSIFLVFVMSIDTYASTASTSGLLHHIFVSVAPQQIIVQRIVGKDVQVEMLVQPGQDPHTYEPTPRQIARLAQADLYVRIGIPFEDVLISRIRSVNPHMDIINLRAELNLPPMHEHSMPSGGSVDPIDPENIEFESALDPHIWTSPPLVRRMGAVLLEYLIQRDPSNESHYRVNVAEFNRDIDVLEHDIRETLETHGIIPCRFMVFHPAWGHFAATYGLTQIPIEHDGKSPGAKTLGTLIDQAKSWRLRVIFVQPQFDRKAAQIVANALNGEIEVLDPLAVDYFGNLRHVASRIVRACTL